jgi:hypothetical protein
MRERRFPVIFVASATGLVSVILVWLTYYHVPTAPLTPLIASPHAERWTFDSRTDSRNLGLSDEQCDVGFSYH